MTKIIINAPNFSLPVSAKVKRQRANRRLRRLLCPKTAVMALHELINKEKTGTDLDISVRESTMDKTVFQASLEFQGKPYEGFGKWFYYNCYTKIEGLLRLSHNTCVCVTVFKRSSRR